jgi:hypothetical protein
MELLEPLAIADVALSTRHVLHVPGIHKHYFQPSCFENLVERKPVDPRRLHGYGCDSASDQPVGQAVQVAGEGLENTDRDFITVGGDSDVMLCGAAIHPRRIRIDPLQ